MATIDGRQTTTDLDKLRAGHDPFTWGVLLELEDIGPYTIGAFHPWKSRGVTIDVGKADKRISYHIWVDGHDISRSMDSLEGALAVAMAHKHDNINSQAGEMFIRMLPGLQRVRGYRRKK